MTYGRVRLSVRESAVKLALAQDLYLVKIAFEPLGSFNWRAEPSVTIKGKPTWHTIINGVHYVWTNEKGVILGGQGLMHGADVFEAVKYIRLNVALV